ncbi:MAG: hypothetical protein ACR2LN_03675 [Candidatus Levyibacteriota bacterium]
MSHEETWRERYRQALIPHTEAFLRIDSKAPKYRDNLYKLFDEVCTQDNIGEIEGFPQELAQELTRRVIKEKIASERITDALTDAYETNMSDDPDVDEMIRTIADQDVVEDYEKKRRKREETLVIKARIGATLQ